MDIKISKEQQIIVDNFKQGLDLSILAVAGAGKTTTILFLAEENKDKNFLVLTYNRRLSDATKQRIQDSKISNVEMYTYHGFCTKYFGPSHNDQMMSTFIGCPPMGQEMAIKLRDFNVLIIDEMQDMTDLYYDFIHGALEYLEKIQMVLLGDPHQTIYQFNGGHWKYLVDADLYWQRKFKTCYLETSYRLTRKISNVINTLIGSKYKEPFKINTVKKSTDYPVECHFVNIYKKGRDIILKQIETYGVNSVLVISCSVKEKTPIYNCINELSALGVKICLLKDDEAMDPDILQDKLVASTIHKQKGCERRCVVLYGVDCSYHKYYAKNKPFDEYMNLIYVACTRSLEKLIIIGDRHHGFLKNWNESEIKSLTVKGGDMKIYGKPGKSCDCTLEFSCQCEFQERKRLNVTDVLKYRSFTCLNKFIKLKSVKIKTIQGTGPELTSETKVTMQTGLVEQVSAVYGVLIPIIVEYHLHSQIKIIDYILSEDFGNDFRETSLLKHLNRDTLVSISTVYAKIKDDCMNTGTSATKSTTNALKNNTLKSLLDNFLNDFAFLTICVLCYDSYIYLRYQIDNYDWLDPHYILECCNRLLAFKKKFDASGDEKGDLCLGPSQKSDSKNNSEKRIRKKIKTVCIHPEAIPVLLDIWPH